MDEARQLEAEAKSITSQIPLVNVVDESVSQESAACVDVSYPSCSPFRSRLGVKDMVIGRNESCEICLPITSVSRHHARILLVDEEYVVEDLGSTNGTYVNGIKVSRCILRNNDLVRVGKAKLLFTQQRTVRAS